jgi:thioredoxin 1
MLDLYADWCMPCKILSPRLEQIAAEHRDKVDVYKVDVDRHGDIARAFGVRGIPYVVLVRNKQAVKAFTGVQPKEAYVRAINAHARQ